MKRYDNIQDFIENAWVNTPVSIDAMRKGFVARYAVIKPICTPQAEPPKLEPFYGVVFKMVGKVIQGEFEGVKHIVWKEQ